MKRLLNSKDVCAVLGVSPAVLSRWVHSNKVPYILLTSGKKKLVVRFREEDLEAWLKRRSRGAMPKLRSNLSEVDKKIGKTAQHIETKDNVLV
jgi:excisionase family DNA binding protein